MRATNGEDLEELVDHGEIREKTNLEGCRWALPEGALIASSERSLATTLKTSAYRARTFRR